MTAPPHHPPAAPLRTPAAAPHPWRPAPALLARRPTPRPDTLKQLGYRNIGFKR